MTQRDSYTLSLIGLVAFAVLVFSTGPWIFGCVPALAAVVVAREIFRNEEAE